MMGAVLINLVPLIQSGTLRSHFTVLFPYCVDFKLS